MTTLYRYRFGPVEFDEAKAELVVNGLAVDIQRRPLQILSLLLSRSGSIVPREEFFQRIWLGRRTVDNVLANAMTKLRAALGKEGAEFIENVPRIGYRFVGVVERSVAGHSQPSQLRLERGQPVAKRPSFVLERLLGQSAGHEVWLARNATRGERRVFKFPLSDEHANALRREAKIARFMRDELGDRKDLVRLLDWNFAEPPFFLESEYGGEDLRTWSEADGRLASLARRQRLELFLQTVDAVGAAHSIGVLHMDLKPGNILVTAEGDGWKIRLVDFGSGRVLEPERLERLGDSRVGLTPEMDNGEETTQGTLLYTAPEMLQGQTATERSDIYSLGVILYQLLLGDLRRPIVPGWERDIDDEILREEIAGATDIEPLLRTATAAELAKRIRRLEERRAERAKARRDELVARAALEALRRSQARRPWLIGLIATLVAGVAISGSLYVAARNEREYARREANKAEAINRFLNDDLLAAADPTAPGSVNNPRIGDILTTAAIKLSNRFTGDTTTKAEIHATLGRTYAALSDYRNAEKHFREAIALSATDPTDKGLMLQARYELVNVLSQTGAMTEAKSLLDETNAAAGDLRTAPSALGMQAALTNGNYYDSLSDIDQALLQYEAAERMRRVVAPLDTKWLFKIRLSLIGEYIGKRRYREAEILNADLIRPDLTLDAVGAVNWGRTRWCYAEILAQEKRYPEAERLDQEAVGGMRARLGREHFYTGAALSELSNLLVDEGKFAEALGPAVNAYDIMQKTLGTQSQDAILAHVNVGILEFRSGHTAAGLNDLTVARAQLVQLLGIENPLVQQADFYLATALNESGRSAEAWDYATHLSVDALSNGGEGSPEWGARLDGLKGQILLKRGKHAEALALLQPAVLRMTASNVPSWIVDPVKTSLDEATRH